MSATRIHVVAAVPVVPETAHNYNLCECGIYGIMRNRPLALSGRRQTPYPAPGLGAMAQTP